MTLAVSAGLPAGYPLTTALAFLGVLAGLGVGHLIGDMLLQPDRLARAKAFPSDDQLAAGIHPWTGWPACLAHVGLYLAAQAATVVIVALLVPMTGATALTALIISGASHAYIDRRWLVAVIIARKQCTGWAQAPFWVDQALHGAAMLLAAAVAARTTSGTGIAVAAGGGLLLLADALRVEHRYARLIRAQQHRPIVPARAGGDRA
ncbi:DUF3307 domain-containing protein [Paractinoplanes atraurantiacus]|uniref:Uncharacterized protein n=1 Tax=Paractinoplanes atraurantiacus TaxID=1036182 RepID=A0A285KJW5_9ACTN|nr:DUF3307 domain-containing protein [Actinoplanes atraurantiacus]SNY72929.1 Protein of unknown function [Actinoplanes atraurantiacus]